MRIGLGTGSSGTAELARLLGVPHERHWLPWEVDLAAFGRALPEIVRAGGEVGLYLLPYAEEILARCPEARLVCMQRDPGRTVRGLLRKLGGNPFAVDEDAARFHHGFPFYGGVTLAEGCARFYRDYYARAYDLQRRFPDRFAVFFTDHLLSGAASELDVARFGDLCGSVADDFENFCARPRSEWGWVA